MREMGNEPAAAESLEWIGALRQLLEKRPATSIGWTDPRTEPGELMWAERFPTEVIDGYKTRPVVWAGQYQQRPAPAEGDLFKRQWFNYWNPLSAVKLDPVLIRVPGEKPIEKLPVYLPVAFEQVLQSRYLGTKRFSLEGVTALIPLLDSILDAAGEHGAIESVVAMSHRGRLNFRPEAFNLDEYGSGVFLGVTRELHSTDSAEVYHVVPGNQLAVLEPGD